MYLWRGADTNNKKLCDGKPRNVFFSWAAATGLLWLNSMLAFENNSTLLIFYLIYSAQAFPHQARVLILSQNKSLSLFSDMLSLHRQQKENCRIQPQDYITAKQCLFLPQLKFFLLPGISKTGEIWKIERSAAKNKLNCCHKSRVIAGIKHCLGVLLGLGVFLKVARSMFLSQKVFLW